MIKLLWPTFVGASLIQLWQSGFDASKVALGLYLLLACLAQFPNLLPSSAGMSWPQGLASDAHNPATEPFALLTGILFILFSLYLLAP